MPHLGLQNGWSQKSHCWSSSGWWFGTFFIFPYIGNHHPDWLSYFSERLKPPTRYTSAYMSWISYQIHRSHRWVLEGIVTTPKNGCNGWLYDYPRTGNPVLNQPVYWKRGGEGGIGMPIGGTVEAGGRWAQVILQTGWTSNIAIPK